MSNPLLSTLTTSIDVLEAAGIDHAITGSFASAQYGYVRATEAVDLTVVVDDLAELEAASERLPPTVRRVDVATWRFDDRIDVELYVVRGELDRRAMHGRVRQPLRGDPPREVWVVPLEALLVLKVREHLEYPADLKHIDDIRKLLARNPDTLDVAELEALLALDPAWGEAWDALVEPA